METEYKTYNITVDKGRYVAFSAVVNNMLFDKDLDRLKSRIDSTLWSRGRGSARNRKSKKNLK